MNQEKIGKLIAKLRKEKDLTQRELGEMVGVGYRAVSKWETGQTMPDISIINELSEILGISSDELLKGELVPKDDNQRIPTAEIDSKSLKNGNKRKLLLLIVSLLMIIAIIGILIIRNNNKPVEYIIQSSSPNDYLVEGKLYIEGNNLNLKINKIEFQDYNISQTAIKDYRYNVSLNGDFMFGYGGTNEFINIENNNTIYETLKAFQITYLDNFYKDKTDLNDKILLIEFSFIDKNNNIIEKDINAILLKK